MDLFEDLTIKLVLPEKISPINRVGSNKIYKLLFRTTTIFAKLRLSKFSGYFQLETSLSPPLNFIYLKDTQKKGRCPDGVASLKADVEINFENWQDDIQLYWEQFPVNSFCYDADAVNEMWLNQFQFKEEDLNRSLPGLRKPQLGALHAVAAYFATDTQIEPATIVLPTGTGKTETMLATMVYQRCPKILLIVPSDTLRSQISKKFINLGYLPELTVVPQNIALPYVAVVNHSIQTPDEVEKLVSQSNVLIATTSVLTKFSEVALQKLCSLCTHLFVDEAHHIAAKTWLTIREKFLNKRVLQFTATPFRNDNKNIGGKIIYNYSMGEAQRAGYFKNVNLLSVEEYRSEVSDEAIANKAIQQLRADNNNSLDHLLMARAKDKFRAENIAQIYKRLAPELNPIVVHSGFTTVELKNRLDRLLKRDSKIVVCVDMLGEGYDLPNLKIAALHDIHKSLAVTLQFIGRFTRTSNYEKLGSASVVVNLADPEVEEELQQLYSVGSDWDSVLKRLSENKISKEVRLQEVIDSLKEKGNLHKQISLWNLSPNCSVMLFRTFCDNWSPEKYVNNLPKFHEKWHAISESEKLLVVLAVQTSAVNWGNYNEFKDSNYKILIAHWDDDRKALFIYSNDYDAFRVDSLASSITNDKYELVCGSEIFNVFNGVEYPLASNLGTSQIGAISFTQYFGPNVAEGLSKIEESQSSLSNIAALGYEMGNRVIWGCSQKKGKVWSPNKIRGISDWCEWAKNVWDKIFKSDPDKNNLTANFLRRSKLDKPYEEHPITVEWGEYLFNVFESRVSLHFEKEKVNLYSVDIKIGENYYDGSLRLILSTEFIKSEYKLSIGFDISPKGYEYKLMEGPKIYVQRGDSNVINFTEYMETDPVKIYYVDGSFSNNAQIVKVKQDVGLYDKKNIVPVDWQGTDIRSESMGKDSNQNSIQWRWFSETQHNYDVVINDDGKGESADLVGLKNFDNYISLTLIHCKFSSSDMPGHRLSDLYEVCGQAQRCIRWKHRGMLKLYDHIKHRENQWTKINSTRFLKGTINDLSAIKSRSSKFPIKLTVVIVQPGLRVSEANEECLKLLGSTELYIKKTTLGELIVVGSK